MSDGKDDMETITRAEFEGRMSAVATKYELGETKNALVLKFNDTLWARRVELLNVVDSKIHAARLQMFKDNQGMLNEGRADMRATQGTIAEMLAALPTRNDLQQAFGRLEGRIDSFGRHIEGRIDGLERRFDGRIDGIEQRLDGRIDGLDAKMTTLGNDVRVMGKKIDDLINLVSNAHASHEARLNEAEGHLKELRSGVLA